MLRADDLEAGKRYRLAAARSSERRRKVHSKGMLHRLPLRWWLTNRDDALRHLDGLLLPHSHETARSSAHKIGQRRSLTAKS